ncbi:hypothetical protein ACFWPH_00065 [Nocardia sp. NPDC058499]|uniref:hypothetical protein n=1 Tax=Nocardia sp. NPDC058499 TaxID=3346530 RepID=UPI00364996E8
MSTIEWQCPLERYWSCTLDVIGQEFPTAVAGHSVTVHFPADLDTVDRDRMLQRPKALKAPSAQVDWGVAVESRDAADILRFALIADDVARAEGESLNSETDMWLKTSMEWLAVTTGQPTVFVGHQSPLLYENKTFMYEIPDGASPSFIRTFSKFNIPRDLEWVRADKAVMGYCFDKAGAGIDLPLAWKLLNEARALHRVGQFRRAVIDASGAVEIIGYQLLDSELTRSTPPDIAKHLMESGNLTLGKLVDLLRKTGYSIDPDLSPKLVGLRNSVLHSNRGTGPHEPTESESKGALALATAFVKKGCPLPADVPAIYGSRCGKPLRIE